MPYAELVSRSAFSLLDGASLPEALIEAAAQCGISHLGIADRDAVYGLVRAHRAAQSHGISLVCGASVTLEGHPSVVLLCENKRGWSNLCHLLSAGRKSTQKGFSQVSLQQLCERAEGVRCLLRYGWQPSQLAALREAFGHRLDVMLSRTLTPGDLQRTRWATHLSSVLGRPPLATNDVLYASPEQRPLADILTCIRRRTTLDAAGRALRANMERHLLDEACFRRRFCDLPEAIAQAERVAAQCTFSLSELSYTYPREVVPEGWTAMTWLRALTQTGLQERYPDGASEQVRAQVEHELGVIEALNFPAYFLTVYDIVRFARSRGILCQGRGSAANSAVCYVLGITAVDPSRASLLFERFISEERGEPPDIDVDFEHERREEVIQYVYERYGRHRAALVNEVISYRSRSAIRDVGKVFGLSLDQVDRLARSSDRWAAGTGASREELVREAGLDPTERTVQQTLFYGEQLRGFPRHLSIHVGGFVIADQDLLELVPVEPASMEARTVIQWDKYDIDELRFIKVDVLGLGMLTAIRKGFDLVAQYTGTHYELATVPAEDPAVYDMFCRAETMGVFQIESRAQMSMLPRLRPRCFYDLVIEVAIVRPGPIQGGMVHPYLRRRSGEEPITYPHPDLAPILQRTMGVPLFQEQVMAIAVAVGGFSAGKADQLRRAMGAWRKTGSLDGIGLELMQGMVERGIAPDYAKSIFAQIKGFGEYGFPESHAASFALLVYVSGWLKCHHYEAFTAALINSQPMGFYSPRALVAGLQREGGEVRPVCVVHSEWDCTLEAGPGEPPSPEHGTLPSWRPALRLGLRMVQGLGEEQAAAILSARDTSPFSTLADFAQRTGLNRGALQMLSQAGALEHLGASPRESAWILQGLWTDLPLLAALSRREPAPSLPAESEGERIRAEYDSMGLSVHTHPLSLLREELQAKGVSPIRALTSLETDTTVRLAGLVQSRQRPGTANGVVFMTLEDETAMANLVIWPRIWAQFRQLARNAPLIGIDGTVQRQGEAVSVLVTRLWQLDNVRPLKIASRNFR